MGKGCLRIYKPEIRLEKENTVLFSKIKENGTEKEISYSVENKYSKYLVTERSDAFVTAILYYAMFKDFDIEWEGLCSEQLIAQIKLFYIPTVANNYEFMHEIELNGAITSERLQNEGKVGTGYSGGVDSLYTVHRFIESKYTKLKLTHAVFTDFFTEGMGEEYQELFWQQNMKTVKPIVEAIGMEFVPVRLKIDSMYSVGKYMDPVCGIVQDAGFFPLKYCSIPMALNKLFSTYYFSSGWSAQEANFKSGDFSSHDILAMPLISTENLKFYSSGEETGRLGKLKEIVDWTPTKKYLQVCMWDSDEYVNCGTCDKCKRTMNELYALGKLEEYRERFPVDYYKKHLSKYWAYVLLQKCKGHLPEVEMIKYMKDTNKEIVITAYFLLPFYIVFDTCYSKIRYVKWARKLYNHISGADRLLHGKSLVKMKPKQDALLNITKGK